MNLHTTPSSSLLNDFFVVAGLADDFKLLQSINPAGSPFSSSAPASPSSTNSKTLTSSMRSTSNDLGTKEESSISSLSINESVADTDNDNVDTITSIVFHASITDYYGSTDAGAMPEGIELFAFPQGLRLVQRSSMPKYHSFVHTSESGLHLYGSCLTFFEKISDEQIQRAHTVCKETKLATISALNISDFRGMYVPRVICIISRWPFIDSFREVLCEFYRLSCTPCDLPLERYICNFIDDIPAPPASGNTNIYFYINDKGIDFECPPANQPTAWNGIPIAPVMESLDAANIIELFTAVLCERQILFVSSQYSLLTYAAETITSLLYPLVWSHVYIPLLPFQLIGVLEAPMPFIVGIHSSWLKFPDLHINEEATIVYLDENRIEHGVIGPPPKMNEHRYQKLLSAIQEFAPVFAHRDALYSNDWNGMRLATFDNAFQLPSLPLDTNHDSGMDNMEVNEKKLRECFLNFFVSVLIHYRSYLVKGQKYKKFKDVEFIKSQPADSRDFFSTFTKSQAFHQFIDERLLVDATDPDVAFFEESIAAKINRCKSRKSITMMFSGKIATPFLDEIQSHVTHVPPKPDNSGLTVLKKNQDDKFVYNSFPKMNTALFSHTKLSYVSPAEIRTLTSRHTRLKRRAIEITNKQSSSILVRPLSALNRFTPSSNEKLTQQGKSLDGRKTFRDTAAGGGTPTSSSSTSSSSSSPMNNSNNHNNIGGIVPHDGTGFEYSTTTTVRECIKSIYLVLLAQFSRHQSIKSGRRRGKFKSTAAIIGEYTDLRTAADGGELTISALSPEMISPEDARYMYSPSRTPTTIHGDVVLKFGKSSTQVERNASPLSHSSSSSGNSTPEKDGIDRRFQFINWCFHNANVSTHSAILTLQRMAFHHEFPDDIAYRLLADACAAGFLPERAIDLMVVMEKQGVIIDSKIATKISVAFSGSDDKEIALMTAADVMYIENWALFKVNSLGLHSSDEPAGEYCHREYEDNNDEEWIGFSTYKTPEMTDYGAITTDAATGSVPLWRYRQVINPSDDTLAMLQWSDELLCQLIPGIKIDLNNPAGTSCPSATCGRDLKIFDLYEGWDTDPNQYKGRCMYCGTEFVPRFTVLCDFMGDIKNGDENNDRILWCELLSPWVLAKEIKTILIEDGIKTFIKPSFRVSHHVIFWNMILAFRLHGLPYVFLLQEGFRQQGIMVNVNNE